MPRSKTKRKKGSEFQALGAATPARVLSRPVRRRLFIGSAVAAVAAAVWIGFRPSRAECAFLDLAKSGRALIESLPLHPDLGNAHLQPGQRYHYGTLFPLSGPHDDIWTQPGFYVSRQPPERLVHALEHGNIVIHYDAPGTEVVETLKRWAGLYPAMWSGIVATPMPGIGEAVVLTAWRRMLRLDTFDAVSAAAFIDAFRGRGPENPVR